MFLISKPSLTLIGLIQKKYINVGVKNGYFNRNDISIDYLKREIEVCGYNHHHKSNFKLRFLYGHTGDNALGVIEYDELNKLFKFKISPKGEIYTLELK